MKLVQTLLALALAGAMGSAAAVGPSDLGNLSGLTVSIGNSFSAVAAFSDEYIFDIMPESATAGTAVTINLDIPQFDGQEFAIENFTVAFKDSLNNIIVSDFQASLTDYTLSVFANLPAALDYKFVVSGNVTGTLGGSYGGVLQAVPIPEAKSYAMMLAGLGLIGFTVLRRRGA
ncbi:MAG: FxDxF family PEP-CTERM protein [Betaproteobacteria bacterium]|nr:FxDxF family PEP-CTERM protein [Betaproteobacteria bacterium]